MRHTEKNSLCHQPLAHHRYPPISTATLTDHIIPRPTPPPRHKCGVPKCTQT